MRRSVRHGFTLVEVLVALAILAITSVLAYRATAALADGEARLTAETSRWRSLDAALTRLESDLRQAVPRTVRNGDRRDPAFVATVDPGGNSALVLSRAGTDFSLEPGLAGQRIGYRLADDRLEVVYWPELDNVPRVQPQAFALASDVAALRLDYLTSGGTWTPSWPAFGEPEVPRAARLRLTLAHGETVERWWALR